VKSTLGRVSARSADPRPLRFDDLGVTSALMSMSRHRSLLARLTSADAPLIDAENLFRRPGPAQFPKCQA
jgi:hypothetical protein